MSDRAYALDTEEQVVTRRYSRDELTVLRDEEKKCRAPSWLAPGTFAVLSQAAQYSEEGKIKRRMLSLIQTENKYPIELMAWEFYGSSTFKTGLFLSEWHWNRKRPIESSVVICLDTWIAIQDAGTLSRGISRTTGPDPDQKYFEVKGSLGWSNQYVMVLYRGNIVYAAPEDLCPLTDELLELSNRLGPKIEIAASLQERD